MSPSRLTLGRRPVVLAATLIALGLAAAAAPLAPAIAIAADAADQPIKSGQAYVMATHSFNVFIGPTRSRDPAVAPTPGPLAALAAERGKTGHRNLAVQMIGGSTPMQHWNQGDGDDAKNIAKVALAKGGVDVFTMSPNAKMPEEGIDLFGDLLIKTNPIARLMVQNSWSAWDGRGTTRSVGGGAPPQFAVEDHDKTTAAEIDGWLKGMDSKDGYLARLRAQLQGLDKRAGHRMTYVVPSASAVYALRKEIVAGHVPGVARQSEIFRDGMGHPKAPLANLVTYVWFAAMYRESPVGLKALVDPADPTSAAREKILQQIAWNAVVSEPWSGVTGKTVKLG